MKTKTAIKKQILHIDYDSFFASVEQQANPALRGKPIAITGGSIKRGIAVTASVQAKKFGIKTGTPIFKAKKMCPDIIAVKGDFTKYSYIQKESLRIFNRYTDLVEPFSIDEAFLDVTETVKFYKSAENIAHLIKKDILKEFGPYVTCSIGIGPNKLLAKLVSDFNKPNGLFIVNEKNLDEVLRSVELQDFCGIGPKLENRLNKMGITTVEQLQQAPLNQLYKGFGNVAGSFLKNASLGERYDKVKPIGYKRPMKSVSHQHTLYKNTSDHNEIKANLQRLSQMVAKRMRNNYVLGKTIFMYLRDAKRKGYLQRTTVYRHTNSEREIFEIIEKMFNNLNWKKEVRLVGVGVSNLIKEKNRMKPLFKEDLHKQEISILIDKINDKWGSFTIIPANTLVADQTKNKMSSFLRHK